MAVLRRPAAGAVHVAGGGGIHQDQPRYIDVVLGGILLRCLIAPETALVCHIGQEGFENVGVVLPDKPLGIMCPLPIGVFCDHPQRLIGVITPCALVDLLDHVDELFGKVAYILRLALFQHGIQDRFKCLAFGCMGDFFGEAHSSFVLSVVCQFSCVVCFFR